MNNNARTINEKESASNNQRPITINPLVSELTSLIQPKMSLAHIDKLQSSSMMKPPEILGKVYVNPNYRKPVIHINPNVSCNESIIKYIEDRPLAQSKKPETDKTNTIKEKTPEFNVSQRSVYVNPKLMNKLLLAEKNVKEKLTNSAKSTYIICSKTKLVKRTASVENSQTTLKTCQPSVKKSPPCIKKSSNSQFVTLSKRKLVRRNSKSAVISGSQIHVKKKLSPGMKKLSPKKVSPNTSLSGVTPIKSRYKLIKNIDKNKSNRFKAESTQSGILKRKVISTKKTNLPGIVSISGVIYKSSRNKLVRTSPGSSTAKKRKNVSYGKCNQYYVTSNGKKLQKLNIPRRSHEVNRKFVKINVNSSILKKLSDVSPKQSIKTSISNKMKQRSIEILRNKLKKNNQPCLFFQKFGYCANQKNGTCPKLHDKKQIAICKNFLKGKCLLDKCLLSHDVGPEKMPTCKYFLKGCCIRDGCPYLHVKVSSKTSICHQFLQGYCEKGNECKQRHTYECPEFDRTGQCSKGKSCQYPHKSHTVTKRTPVKWKPQNVVHPKPLAATPATLESRKRYYDETINEDLSQKRETLLNKVKIIKHVHTVMSAGEGPSSDEPEPSPVAIKENNLSSRPKRLPLGPLPAYIPFD